MSVTYGTKPYIERLRKALAFAQQGVRLCWDNDARQIWAEVYKELNDINDRNDKNV